MRSQGIAKGNMCLDMRQERVQGEDMAKSKETSEKTELVGGKVKVMVKRGEDRS